MSENIRGHEFIETFIRGDGDSSHASMQLILRNISSTSAAHIWWTERKGINKKLRDHIMENIQITINRIFCVANVWIQHVVEWIKGDSFTLWRFELNACSKRRKYQISKLIEHCFELNLKFSYHCYLVALRLEIKVELYWNKRKTLA